MMEKVIRSYLILEKFHEQGRTMLKVRDIESGDIYLFSENSYFHGEIGEVVEAEEFAFMYQ